MTIDPDTARPTFSVDSDHPVVRAFAEDVAPGATGRDAAVAIYYAVRDRFRYSPWNVSFEPEGYKASAILSRASAEAHCIDKAVVMAAACRAVGVPARLHFADVRNHVGTARLEAHLGTDLLVFHGYVEVHLDGRWVAATPAFNADLCARLGVEPLEFDGRTDSIFQAYDRVAGRFMEYVTDHGVHVDVPFDAMVEAWRTHYPAVREGRWPRPPRDAE